MGALALFFYFILQEVELKNMANFYGNQQKPMKDNDDLVNESIRFPELLVIGADGEALGVKTRSEALRLASEANLDLLCVAPLAKPPVCKILNYGKHRFEQQKKTKEIKKNQKVIETKEVRLTPQIDDHDMDTKCRAVTKWLEDECKVKVSVRFRGRQMAHLDVGEETLNKFLEKCADFAVIDKKPVLEGKFLSTMLLPKKK